jgi:hypothetical protein
MGRVERERWLVLGETTPIRILGVLFLQMSAVAEEDLAKALLPPNSRSCR